MQSLYGSTNPKSYLDEKDIFGKTRPCSEWSFGRPFLRGSRKALNIHGLIVSLLLPWLLFCFVFALMSFWLRYSRPVVAYSLVIMAFVGGVVPPMCSMLSGCLKKTSDPSSYQPTWYAFLTITCLLAYGAGIVVGQVNYKNYMQANYSLNHLAHYKDVDTNANLGQQYMDAGYIYFKNSTGLALEHSMGFKSHDVFCVAPIVTKESLKGKPIKDMESVDFWAVGKNCCSGVQADFHCKGFADPKAKGAVRLIGELAEDRAFFRLAVQQAEATYKLNAVHPLFFQWVHDPEEEILSFAQRGRLNYLCGIATHFVVQVFLTLVAMVAFSKMVHN